MDNNRKYLNKVGSSLKTHCQNTLRTFGVIGAFCLPLTANAAIDLSDCDSNAPEHMGGFAAFPGSGWLLSSNCIVGNGLNSGDSFIVSTREAQDFVYGADIKIVDGRAAALVFRSNTSGNAAYNATLDIDEGGVKLWKSGVNNGFISFAPVPGLQRNQSYYLEVTANGNQISIKLDGTEVINTTDSTYSSGFLGTNVYNSNSVIQNVEVSRLIAGTWNAVNAEELTGSDAGDGFLISGQTIPDFDFEADVSVSNTASAAALILRATTTGNTLNSAYVVTLDVRAELLKLWRWGGNDLVETQLQLQYDRYYKLRVKATGDLIQVYLDGHLIIQERDSALADGSLGLNIFKGQSSFRNITLNGELVNWPLSPTQASQLPALPLPTNIPVSGSFDPRFEHVNQVVEDQLNASNGTSMGLNVRNKAGDQLMHTGYGWLDRNQTQQTPVDALYRMASISKSYAYQAIFKMLEAGTITINAKAYCLNGETATGNGCLLETNPIGVPDAGASDITVLHLLYHLNGWDQGKIIPGLPSGVEIFDPLANSDLIATHLGINNPPTLQQLLDFRLGLPFDYQIDPNIVFDPNEFYRPKLNGKPARTYYSSYGYTVLSMIVERHTGKSFLQYVHDEITGIPGVGIPNSETQLGYELVGLRNSREPEYISSSHEKVQNKFGPFGDLVFGPDGGGHVANAMGAGGLISTSESLMEYTRNYWLFEPGLRDLNDPKGADFGGGGDGVSANATADLYWPGYNTTIDRTWLANSARNFGGFNERLNSAIKNTLEDGVEIFDVEAVTREDRLFGFHLDQDAAHISFDLKHFGVENCDSVANWYPTQSYQLGAVVRHKGRKFTANADSAGVVPDTWQGPWDSLGDCVAETKIMVKHGSKPDAVSFDCSSESVGNHSCDISNPQAGFYYGTLRSIDNDVRHLRLKADVTPLTTDDCASNGIDPSTVNAYPNWTQVDWQGIPNHAAGGDLMSHNGVVYRAGWWTQAVPGSNNSWTFECNI